MKKNLRLSCLVLGLLITASTVRSQTLQGEWATVNGGSYSVYPPIVHVDNDGIIYQAGQYTGPEMYLGTVMLNGGPFGSAYVAAFGQDGQVMWVQQFTTDSYVDANDFHVDPDGTSRLVGAFSGTYLALPGDTLAKTGDVSTAYFYLILDKQGSVIDFSFVGEPITGSDFSVDSYSWDSQGNMAVTGLNTYNADTLAFGDIGLAVDYYDPSVFVAYFDPQGNPLWAKTSFSTSGEFINLTSPVVTLGNNGQSIISVNYDGLDKVPIFGTDTLKFVTPKNIFIVKFDNTGNMIWATATEGGSSPAVSQLTTDSQNNLILSGTINSDTLRFGSIEFINDKYADDNFVIKIDNSNGIPEWGNMVPTENVGQIEKKGTKGQVPPTIGNYLLLDAQDNIFMLTWFENDSLIFPNDTLLNNLDGGNILIVKYLSDGSYGWSANIPSWNYQPPSAALGKNDMLYVFSNLYLSFSLDSVSFTTDGMSTPAFIMGFNADGTAIYGNLLETTVYNYISTYTIDTDQHDHLILTGSFSDVVHINSITATPLYPENLFLARLAYLTRMTGTVTEGSMTPVDSGTVYLYRLLESGQAPLVDSAELTQNGTYEFKDFTYDDYLVYALADTQKYPDAVGTYFGDEIAWERADTVHAIQDTMGSVDIQLTELTVPLDGQGQITGNVSYATSKKTTTMITGEPVKKVKVILIGTEKSSQNVIAWVYTNDQGQYVFENIPDGNYSIIVDIPGLPMDSTYSINVSGNVVSGLDFLVTGTEVILDESAGVLLPHEEVAQLKLWPNPTPGPVTLSLTKGHIESVTIFNTLGKVVRKLTPDNGLKQVNINLSRQPAGLYYVKVRGSDATGVLTLIIQH